MTRLSICRAPCTLPSSAAQQEVRLLRARLAETEAVAQAVISKLEAQLARREGMGREVTAQLQASGCGLGAVKSRVRVEKARRTASAGS